MRKLSRVLMAGLFLIPMQGAGAAEYKGCEEEIRRVSQLKRVQVPCGKARWVAGRFDEKVTERGTWPSDEMRVGRYGCTPNSTGYETYRIRCTRNSGAIVRFNWGV